MLLSPDRIEKPKSPVILFKISDEEKEILRFFKTHYPTVFNSEKPLPLVRMIHLSMKKVLTENNFKFTSTQFYNAIKNWCSRLKYKEALVNSDYRYNLEGDTVNKVTTQDQEDAFQAIKYFHQEQLLKKTKRGMDKLGSPSMEKLGRAKGRSFYPTTKPFTIEYKKRRS